MPSWGSTLTREAGTPRRRMRARAPWLPAMTCATRRRTTRSNACETIQTFTAVASTNLARDRAADLLDDLRVAAREIDGLRKRRRIVLDPGAREHHHDFGVAREGAVISQPLQRGDERGRLGRG